ncbi:glycosyltransferase family 2 protein [Winogradskyella alexanderae]|uniref:Glycosyltransferase family 2 protein n=1 Tax=Winogradskyella alexanderae TaxID=2877123 RepID=A0ABS7XPV5_9FLAO|nr:glycosyltransferase family 2 protein [Winogradskyella alexanderae]MCA0132048.1 glycosyltransferase family 2 protein [Winogradskyella alexanderae]
MKLSVIILNYNVRYFLELCLKSVERAISNLDGEIIVVDNNSTDGSCEMVKSLFPKVILIENKENCGFAKGNNIGVNKAKGEYLCILNPDTVVSEDTFEKIIEFYDVKPNAGIVGCHLIDGTGSFLPESKRNIPTPTVALKKMLGCSKSYYANHINENEIGIADIFVGAFMFLKTSIYRETGGFDEDYFMYGEDIDLSYRIKKAGYQNYYFGETSVIHFKGESTLKDTIYAKRFFGAMQIFYKKHFKRNLVFDTIVGIGINLSKHLKFSKVEKPIYINNIFVYSDKTEGGFKGINNRKVHILENLEAELTPNAMLIYDCDYISFTSIIYDIRKRRLQKNLVFRFLLKGSNFIIGSDSSVRRGAVDKI